MGKEILKMEHITKIYPNGVMANRDVSFSVREGEIHALMGENGAGKSTLMKILFGDEDATEGDIIFEGNKIQPKSAADTIRLGIGMVHQHFMLVDSLRVYENVILGMEPKNGIMIDKEKAIRAVEETAKKYNLKIDPMAVVGELSVSQKQKVEILKVLLRGAKLLILDEPTAVLTPQETDELFEQLLLLMITRSSSSPTRSAKSCRSATISQSSVPDGQWDRSRSPTRQKKISPASWWAAMSS